MCGHCLVPTNDAKPAIPSSMPTEVLPGFLFLGSYDHASRAELLKALGIGHILNVSRDAVCLEGSLPKPLQTTAAVTGYSERLAARKLHKLLGDIVAAGPSRRRCCRPDADCAHLPEPVQKLL